MSVNTQEKPLPCGGQGGSLSPPTHTESVTHRKGDLGITEEAKWRPKGGLTEKPAAVAISTAPASSHPWLIKAAQFCGGFLSYGLY